MKKSNKIILLILTFLLPVFVFMVISGLYTQLFYGSVNPSFPFHQNYANEMKNYGPGYAMQSFHSFAQFMTISISVFIIGYIVIFLIYCLNLLNKQMRTEDRVFWFIIFIITIGIGMLFYFFKYIWKNNDSFSQQGMVETVE
jgi:hypothetical protein